MHDRTRRLICRIGFVLLGLVPTLAVAGWSAHVHSPSYLAARRTEWEQRIEQTLGLAVAIGRLERATHDRIDLADLTLADLETDALVCRVRQAQVRFLAREIVVIASQPELIAGQLPRAWNAIEHRLLRGSRVLPRVTVTCQEATIATGVRGRTITDVVLVADRAEEGPRADLRFHVAGEPRGGDTVHLYVSRNRELSPPRTRWQLATGSQSLDGDLLSFLFPALQRLGPRWRFQGELDLGWSGAGCEGQLQGLVRDVDLDHLMELFPHKLTGQASLELATCRLENGRIRQLAGRITGSAAGIPAGAHRSDETGVPSDAAAEPEHESPPICGIVQRLWLEATRDALGLELRGLDPGDDVIGYRGLDARFSLDARGLTVRGECDDDRSVLVGIEGPILSGEATHPVPAVAIARWLAPKSQNQVAASAQTEWLLSLLELPSLVPGSDQPATATELRLVPRHR